MDRSLPALRTRHPMSRRHLWLLCLFALLVGCVSDEIHEIPAEPVCATPAFQPPPGVYIDSALVSIACLTPDATIRYTLDGSEPADSSEVYARPLALRAATTIRARAEKTGYQPSDIASAAYEIRTACRLTLTTPNGGESWIIGTTYLIRWNSSSSCGDSVHVLLLRDGSPCETIAQATENDGVIRWTAAACGGPGFLFSVRVIDLDSGSHDDSDGLFGIAFRNLCPIAILAPNGGERWVEGTIQDIRWISRGCEEPVTISLVRNGEYRRPIESSTADDGHYSWRVARSDPDSTGYAISVSSPTDVDWSDAPFTIAPSPLPCRISLLEPTASSVWREGDSPAIVWTAEDCFGDVRIEWLFDGQRRTAWTVRNNGIEYATLWRGTYEGACGYSIRITDLFTGATATTDGEFCMTPCEMEITQPDEGDTLYEGRVAPIRWESSAPFCTFYDPVRIWLVLGGEPCALLAEDEVNDGRHEWFVQRCQSEVAGPYRLVVVEADDFADTSGVFTIEYPPSR